MNAGTYGQDGNIQMHRTLWLHTDNCWIEKKETNNNSNTRSCIQTHFSDPDWEKERETARKSKSFRTFAQMNATLANDILSFGVASDLFFSLSFFSSAVTHTNTHARAHKLMLRQNGVESLHRQSNLEKRARTEEGRKNEKKKQQQRTNYYNGIHFKNPCMRYFRCFSQSNK